MCTRRLAAVVVATRPYKGSIASSYPGPDTSIRYVSNRLESFRTFDGLISIITSSLNTKSSRAGFTLISMTATVKYRNEEIRRRSFGESFLDIMDDGANERRTNKDCAYKLAE